MWYWLFKYVLFTPGIRLILRPKVEGMEKIPVTGGVVLAANHSSAWDTLILPAMVRRRVTFPAKAELFQMSIKHPGRSIVAIFLKAIGQVPIHRGGRSSSDGLGKVHATLQEGNVVGIFPEGTRSVDGRLYRAHTGVSRLALTTDVPVIPVGLVGMDRRFPFRPRIVVGDPVTYYDLAAGKDEHGVLRWVADDVIARIAELTGQTYVDLYGSSVKRGRVTPEEADAQITADPHRGAPRPSLNP